MPVTISKTTRTLPKGRFAEIATAILGSRYEVSIVFVGSDRARAINHASRGKTYVPNVLSFPLGERAGEIFICPAVAAREAAKFSLSPTGYLEYLCVHGCLHLTGLDHGEAMDKAEARYLRRFTIV
jgi:probable rRNA maturation factor